MNGKKAAFLLSILLLLLSGCGEPDNGRETSTSAAVDAAAITPYQTMTPFQTIAPTATTAPTHTPPPLPTPTPFMHTVAEGETLIGIAIYYGITLDEINLANPDVNPNFLSVGTQLVIPLPEDGEQPDAASASDPEIMPLQTGELACTPNQLGGLSCFWPVTNTLDQPVENLTALIRLYDAAGVEPLSQTAYGLVNVLQPGEQIPLSVYFPPPLPDWETSQAQLTGAATANQVDERYLKAEVTELETTPLSDDRLAYQVSGVLTLSPLAEEALPAYAWVVAVAYDGSGQVAGLRRWEAQPEQLAASIDFSFQVYSLAEPIARVEVLAEGRAP